MILTGVLLLSGLFLLAVEGVGYRRGGYGSAFWRLPLDAKLDHVAQNSWAWWWISIWSLVGLFTVTGGVFAIAHLLSDSGAPVLAYVALGAYVVSLVGWVWGLTMQAGVVSMAAQRRVESGSTPDWIHPLWRVGYVTEGVWVIGANLAYAVLGLAILGTDILPAWSGWVALAVGLLIPLGTVVTRDGFPQLAVVVPAVIGVALLLRAL